MRTRTKCEKELDEQVERFYYKHCGGRAINVMDIGEVFKAGREAAGKCESVEQAVIDAIEKYAVSS